MFVCKVQMALKLNPRSAFFVNSLATTEINVYK